MTMMRYVASSSAVNANASQPDRGQPMQGFNVLKAERKQQRLRGFPRSPQRRDTAEEGDLGAWESHLRHRSE